MLLPGQGGIGVTAQLETGFYNTLCPNVSIEDLIESAVVDGFNRLPGDTAGIVRLFFHDCFVRGCDASLLLDGSSSEQTGAPNAGTLRGQDIIDAAKAAIEDACPGVVSCADILAYAARDSIVVAGGPHWEVEAGRRDGSVSQASDTLGPLPGPGSNVNTLNTAFSNQGLSQTDMVALSGAHTIGQAHCSSIANRLSGNDSTLNPDYRDELIQECPLDGSQAGSLIDNDPTPPATVFDNRYYLNLLQGRGLFFSDQVLHEDAATSATVEAYAGDQSLFFADFITAMLKMGRINVLTGTDGEIRTNCHVVNTA